MLWELKNTPLGVCHVSVCFVVVVPGKMKYVEPQETQGILEQTVRPLYFPISTASRKICSYARSHAGTSTVTSTDWALTLLFAHTQSYSTEILRRWT